MKIFSLAFFVTPECHTPLQCQRSMNSNLSFRAISRTMVSKLLPLYPILMILYPILTILLSQLHQFNNSFDRIVKSLEELLETSLFCNDFSHFYFILCFQTFQSFLQHFIVWLFAFWCMYSSMTTLLTHTVAHSTKPSFMPKTNNQPPKKFLSLALSWAKVVKNWTSF